MLDVIQRAYAQPGWIMRFSTPSGEWWLEEVRWWALCRREDNPDDVIVVPMCSNPATQPKWIPATEHPAYQGVEIPSQLEALHA